MHNNYSTSLHLSYLDLQLIPDSTPYSQCFNLCYTHQRILHAQGINKQKWLFLNFSRSIIMHQKSKATCDCDMALYSLAIACQTNMHELHNLQLSKTHSPTMCIQYINGKSSKSTSSAALFYRTSLVLHSNDL